MKDSKSDGMNWTGNIYHKIEGIVPEVVSDIMIQDTFKYVENHVHTVGGTFKKFCSGVVQDLFPLSLDPVKYEAKAAAPDSNDECDNSVMNIVQISSDAESKESPAEIDAVDHADKDLGHISIKHHNEDELRNATSKDIHEDPDSILAARKSNVSSNENSKLSNDVDSGEEHAVGPLDDTFKYVEDHVHAMGGALKKLCSGVVQDFFPLSVDPVNCETKAMAPEGDAAIGSCGDNKSVISMAETSSDAVVKQSPVPISAIGHVEKQLGHISTGHENAGELKNAMSMDSHEKSDSILAPGKINVLTNENSDERLELNSQGVAQSLEASSPVDILGDDGGCDFGASSDLSETAVSVVSGEETITGTGTISFSSSISRDSTYTPGYSSDISSAEEFVSDSRRQLLSSTPASTMSTKDRAIEKQLAFSCSHLSLESNDDSSAIVADSGLETIDLSDEAKLGESCVFIDDSFLYDASRRARKLGSYKKKIRDIFASKRRLAKEYEQLAIWYGDASIESSQDVPFGSWNLQTASDSEWELL